jgi:hypothetical protein
MVDVPRSRYDPHGLPILAFLFRSIPVKERQFTPDGRPSVLAFVFRSISVNERQLEKVTG